MGDMDGSVTVITGASGGLGAKLYALVSARGSFPIGAARSVDKLASLKQRFGGDFVSYDATDSSSASRLLDAAYARVDALGASRLYVVCAAAQHEDPTIHEDGSYSTVDSIRSLHGQEYIDFLTQLNREDPKRLLAGLSGVVDSRFLFISSQAADASFWELGNSLYGRHKKSVEDVLLSYEGSASVLAARYPFFDTPMAHEMYDQLVSRGESLPPKEQAIASLDVVAESTVDLLVRGCSERFSLVRGDVVFGFEGS